MSLAAMSSFLLLKSWIFYQHSNWVSTLAVRRRVLLFQPRLLSLEWTHSRAFQKACIGLATQTSAELTLPVFGAERGCITQDEMHTVVRQDDTQV